ncbi:UNVERIFIED_CONTAM: OVARIAN TUMOR DOMAIN-containing deubiquitinating enzyme 4, partial [Sesamum radiatum]
MKGKEVIVMLLLLTELSQEESLDRLRCDCSAPYCTGIPGDGRCLFRSVAHGACIRSGKPVPSENLQRELADELRARVADEFMKRREETE